MSLKLFLIPEHNVSVSLLSLAKIPIIYHILKE